MLTDAVTDISCIFETHDAICCPMMVNSLSFTHGDVIYVQENAFLFETHVGFLFKPPYVANLQFIIRATESHVVPVIYVFSRL